MVRLASIPLLFIYFAGLLPAAARGQLATATIGSSAARTGAEGGRAASQAIPDESDPPFNNNKTPLGEQEFLLLNESGYRIQADGTIRAPGSIRSLGRTELQMDIEELQGRKRLKAMIELDVLFGKFGYKNLPADVLADVRRVSRQNWSILPERVRADLRQYFSKQELEGMEHGIRIVRAPATWMPLEEMDLPGDMAWPGAAAPAGRPQGTAAPTTMVQSNATPVPQEVTDAEAQAAAMAAALHAQSSPQAAQAILNASGVGVPQATATAPATQTTTPSAATPPVAAAPAAPAATTSGAPPITQAMANLAAPTAPAATQASISSVPQGAAAPTAQAAAVVPAPSGQGVPTATAPTAPIIAAQTAPTATAPASAVPSVPTTATPPTQVAAAQSPAPSSAMPALDRLRELEALEAAKHAGQATTVQPSSGEIVAAAATNAANATTAASAPGGAGTSFKVSEAAAPRIELAAAPVAPNAASAVAPGGAVAAAAAKPAAPPPSAQTPAVPPPVIAYQDYTVEAFNKFLEDAPFGHEVQAMLKLINEHAPTDIRRQAVGYVGRRLPLVVIDSARAGAELRASVRKIHDDPNKPGQFLIILNEGPLLLTKRSMLLRSREYLAPDDPTFYADRGVQTPATQAATSPSASDKETVTDWGKMRVYGDGSRRLRYSTEQLAGTLLAEILRLSNAPLASGADRYRLELLARSAQFMFYRKLKEDTSRDPLIDVDLLAEYQEWLSSPDDYADYVLEAMAAPSQALVAPSLSGTAKDRDAWSRRHDIAMLDQAGLEVKPEVKKSLNGPAPMDAAGGDTMTTDQNVLQEIKGLEANSPLNAAWLSQEMKFRIELNASK